MSKSSAGTVRSTGNCEPGGIIIVRPWRVHQFHVAVADQVEVADRGLGAGGELDAAVGIEL